MSRASFPIDEKVNGDDLIKKNKVTRADYEQWRAGQDETAGRIASDPDRLLFHVEPELGWLNDPNGLVQIGDTYHIYHQYDPFDAAHGGPVLWNHLTTKDFVTYENHGPALFPDSDLDSNGAYSGSAFVRDGKIHYFYTGNVKHFDRDDYDYVLTGREQNQIHMVAENPDELGEKCIAVGPVDYPDDIGTHVRDPKILEHDGIYYMVLGARTKDDRGCVLVYTSRNLEDWSYATRIELGEKFGFMWECPDLFELDGELILVCCPQGVPADGWRYRNPHQCVWFPIEADWEAPSFKIVGQGMPPMVDAGLISMLRSPLRILQAGVDDRMVGLPRCDGRKPDGGARVAVRVDGAARAEHARWQALPATGARD